MTTKRYLPDDRHQKAPELPTSRPPTRRETWEHFHAIYFDFKGHRPTPLCTDRCLHANAGVLEAFCKEAWAWYYVSAYNFGGWRKQPEWVEGDPVIPEAVPDRPFESGSSSAWERTIRAMIETAAQLKEAA